MSRKKVTVEPRQVTVGISDVPDVWGLFVPLVDNKYNSEDWGTVTPEGQDAMAAMERNNLNTGFHNRYTADLVGSTKPRCKCCGVAVKKAGWCPKCAKGFCAACGHETV